MGRELPNRIPKPMSATPSRHTRNVPFRYWPTRTIAVESRARVKCKYGVLFIGRVIGKAGVQSASLALDKYARPEEHQEQAGGGADLIAGVSGARAQSGLRNSECSTCRFACRVLGRANIGSSRFC
jgi:hypothetical protein